MAKKIYFEMAKSYVLKWQKIYFEMAKSYILKL